MDVTEAVRASNTDVGGRLLEFSGKEFMVRGRGYVRAMADLEKVVLKTDERGTPVLVRDVGTRRARPGDPRAASRTSTGGATRWAASSSCATARTPAT